MTHLPRYLVGSVLLVGFALHARSAEPDKLLPGTTDTVLQVNIKQILESDIAKKYALEKIKQSLDNRDVKTMLAEVGLDPLKDIDQLVIGTSGDSKSEMKFLGILHGNFTPEKLYKAAMAQTKKDPDKYSQIKEGDTVIFKFIPEGGDQSFYLTMIDENTVIAANEKKLIINAVAASKSNRSAALSKELSALIKKMDDKASVYAVSVVKGKLDEFKIPPNPAVDFSGIQDVLPKIETVSLSVSVKTDVNIQVTVGMKDENSAGDFRNAFDELFNQLKPLAQLAGAANPKAKPLTDILNSIKSSTKDKDVVISGKLTGANIGRIVNPDDDQ